MATKGVEQRDVHKSFSDQEHHKIIYLHCLFGQLSTESLLLPK